MASATPKRLAVGCVLSDPLGSHFADGELAFLSNLKSGALAFTAGKGGLEPDRCVLDPRVLRDLQRRLDRMQ